MKKFLKWIFSLFFKQDVSLHREKEVKIEYNDVYNVTYIIVNFDLSNEK
jgi:hypothetical protein